MKLRKRAAGLALGVAAAVTGSSHQYAEAQEVAPNVYDQVEGGEVFGAWGGQTGWTYEAKCTGTLGSTGRAWNYVDQFITAWVKSQASGVTAYVQVQIKCVGRNGGDDEWFTVNGFQGGNEEESWLPYYCGNQGGSALVHRCRVAEVRNTCPAFNASDPDSSPGCVLPRGEGDCDDDYDCAGSLRCRHNVGKAITKSTPADVDVCVVNPLTYSPCRLSGGPTSDCTAQCPCDAGEPKDCDSDSQCFSPLVCAHNRGADFGVASDVDICVYPAAK